MMTLLLHRRASSQVDNIKESITYLEKVSDYIEYKGHGDEALSIGSTIERIVNLKYTSATEAVTLHDYFIQQ